MAIEPPPAADTLDRELGSVVAYPDVYNRSVPRNVVGAVGHGFAAAELREVMHVHFRRLSSRPPRATRVAELPYQFLLLRVYRDDRILGPDEGLHLAVHIAELFVPLGVLRTLF